MVQRCISIPTLTKFKSLEKGCIIVTYMYIFSVDVSCLSILLLLFSWSYKIIISFPKQLLHGMNRSLEVSSNLMLSKSSGTSKIYSVDRFLIRTSIVQFYELFNQLGEKIYTFSLKILFFGDKC